MTTQTVTRDTFHAKGWQAIVSLAMVVGGCTCFILGCVAAMIITNKNR